jgi:ubiquinone/menaquinone biosynthesis C-methylase UbiE
MKPEMATLPLPFPLPSLEAAAGSLRWARYLAAHEAVRLPLIGLHRAGFALARQRSIRNRALEQTVRRRYRELLERDFDNVRRGLYPSELLFDSPLRPYRDSVPHFVLDLPKLLGRMRRRDHRDLPADVDLGPYPQYYRRNFHWQTDGYLSEASARIYDIAVEFLFVGCADVMRRQALAEVSRHVRSRPVRLLDVGAGTGRFLSQAALALPESKLEGVELSPFYARFAERRWAARPRERGLRMTVANAEALPFAAGSFDVVTCIFVLHELPRKVRRRVLEELRRVLVPGGLCVLEDAAQPTESPELEPALSQFSRDLHEPFFEDYLTDDLGALLAEVGFRVQNTAPHFVSKVVTALA